MKRRMEFDLWYLNNWSVFLIYISFLKLFTLYLNIKEIRFEMKVLHILNSLNYSGAEMMILNSKKEFQTFKIENEILITNKNKGKAYLDFKKKKFDIQHLYFNEISLIKYLINIYITFKIFIF